MRFNDELRPDDSGWIELKKHGKRFARFHPARGILHIKTGRAEAFFDLAAEGRKMIE